MDGNTILCSKCLGFGGVDLLSEPYTCCYNIVHRIFGGLYNISNRTMEKLELDKLVMKWIEEKKTRPSRINRPLTYTLYNELLKPKMRRSEKDCTCLDRDSDYKVTNHIENHYKLETPLPPPTPTKVERVCFCAGAIIKYLVLAPAL